MEMEGSENFFKKGGKTQWGVSRQGVFPYFIEVFLEIPHDAVYGKILMCLFFLCKQTNMCYKIIALIKI